MRFLEITLDIASRPPFAVDIDAPSTPINSAAPTANGMWLSASSGYERNALLIPGRKVNATIPSMLVGTTVSSVRPPPITAPLCAVFPPHPPHTPPPHPHPP